MIRGKTRNFEREHPNTLQARRDECTFVNMDIADTNIFLAVALDEPEKDRILQLTSNTSAIAPEILPYEIGNALSAMVKRRRLAQNEALAAEESAGCIPVRLISVNVRAALRIATTHGIYAYDAYFLQCAWISSQPLLTLDRHMRAVAGRLGVRLLESLP